MSALKVKVIGPHRHRGKEADKGEIIELPERLARRMVSVYKTGEWPKSAPKGRKDAGDQGDT